MTLSAKHTGQPAYYEALADKLDELADVAQEKSGEGSEMVVRLKTYADRIRADVNHKNP